MSEVFVAPVIELCYYFMRQHVIRFSNLIWRTLVCGAETHPCHCTKYSMLVELLHMLSRVISGLAMSHLVTQVL